MNSPGDVVRERSCKERYRSPSPQPSHPQKPGERRRNRSHPIRDSHPLPPPPEPGSRSKRIHLSQHNAPVLHPVLQHIHQGIAHLPRRRQSPVVKPIREHRSLPLPQLIEPLGEADQQPLHPPRQRLPVLRLHDPVNMRILDTEVHDPHPEPIPGLLQSIEHLGPHPSIPQPRQPLTNPHRHMTRRRPIQATPEAHEKPPAHYPRVSSPPLSEAPHAPQRATPTASHNAFS